MCFTHVSDKMREHLCELTRSTVLSVNIKNSSLTTDGNPGSMEYRSFHQRMSMKVMRTNNPLFWHSWTLRHILESTKCSGFTMMTLPQGSFSGMILLSASQTPLPPISYRSGMMLAVGLCVLLVALIFQGTRCYGQGQKYLTTKVNLPVPRSSVVLQVPHTSLE